MYVLKNSCSSRSWGYMNTRAHRGFSSLDSNEARMLLYISSGRIASTCWFRQSHIRHCAGTARTAIRMYRVDKWMAENCRERLFFAWYLLWIDKSRQLGDWSQAFFARRRVIDEVQHCADGSRCTGEGPLKCSLRIGYAGCGHRQCWRKKTMFNARGAAEIQILTCGAIKLALIDSASMSSRSRPQLQLWVSEVDLGIKRSPGAA